jgi:hypothetical protein
LTTRLLIPNLKHSPTDTLFLFSLSLSLSLSTGTFWHYLQQSIKHWAKVTPSLVGRKADRVQLQDSRPKEGGKLAHTKKVGKIKPDNGGSQWIWVQLLSRYILKNAQPYIEGSTTRPTYKAVEQFLQLCVIPQRLQQRFSFWDRVYRCG